MSLEIHPIPALKDNYIWALVDAGHCVLVDPGEAAGALEFLRRGQLTLAGLLLTHHHPDHIGGVDRILDQHPAPAWGSNDPRMPSRMIGCAEGDRVTIPELELEFEVLETPGHTTSHVAFVGHGLLFSGDTLFAAGCGRLFEGTPAQMQASLDKLAALPDETKMYCGHEYTLANCRFAHEVEPENEALTERLKRVEKLREANRVTLPATLSEERATNPFLRTREPGVIRAAEQRESIPDTAPETVFGVIRRWKDAL